MRLSYWFDNNNFIALYTWSMCSTWRSWGGSRSWSWTRRCNCKKLTLVKLVVKESMITDSHMRTTVPCVHHLFSTVRCSVPHPTCRSIQCHPSTHLYVALRCYVHLRRTIVSITPFSGRVFSKPNTKSVQSWKSWWKRGEACLYSSWLSKPTASGHSDMHRVLV